jgi:hypothetical protein
VQLATGSDPTIFLPKQQGLGKAKLTKRGPMKSRVWHHNDTWEGFRTKPVRPAAIALPSS